ncbi:thioredoxin-like domain-containing protein [Triangularia verruculosa]|uniref:Protein disulfide-isomerase n=1 Tax=Triangularia verruculosa TaxID=2587418 RepID=A0AAN6XA32_9PEZI|nr:thioredoxin-like domain-containing protein [Triangularia verruculosa]
MMLTYCALLLLLPRALAAWDHLEGKELKTTLAGRDHTLVAFVLPDEEHSQALESEWAAISEHDRENLYISIDCSTDGKLCQQYNVHSCPTIRLYKQDGTYTSYRGPRISKSIKSFLQRQSRLAVSHVDDKSMPSFQTSDDITFIGHFGPTEKPLEEEFTRLAERYRDRFSFAIADHASVVPKLLVECFNNIDETGLTANSNDLASPGALQDFILSCSTPLVPEMTRRNEMEFFQTRKSIVYFFTHSQKAKDGYVSEIRPLAKKYDEYLHFVTIDAKEYADAAQMMGLRDGTGLSVQNPNNGDVFPYTRKEVISAGVVEAFLGDIIQGKVKPWKGEEQHDQVHDEL